MTGYAAYSVTVKLDKDSADGQGSPSGQNVLSDRFDLLTRGPSQLATAMPVH